MERRVAEQALGAGPMATLLEDRTVEARLGSRDTVEPWRRVPLRWGDHGTRSLVVMALTAGAVLVAYGITLLLEQPPAFEALLALRVLGVMLLVLAIALAPSSRDARLIAAWALVLHALVAVTGAVMVSTDVFGRLRIGAISAVEFAGFITWVAVMLLLRMRHPVTVLTTLMGGCLAGLAFFGRVLPLMRERLEAQAGGQAAVLIVDDDAIASLVIVGVGVALVIFAWWIDGWARVLLPMSTRSSDLPVRSERERIRLAGILTACMLDPVAIVLLHLAKQPTAQSRLDPDEDWFATALLVVAYAKLTICWVAVTTIAIWLLDPAWL
ncbi:hypothetical protein GCM10009846_13240 [Agrococcus versicolor]|uniref:Copper resistance protein D domain-containing protein n=1 Tax=Agrococcus versicolor TaxID=501482 RepID=A0ABN3AP46_9MICO